MSIVQVALLLTYSVGLLAGQMLFKLAARAYAASPAASPLEKTWVLATNIYFLMAVGLYCALSVFWVWLLTQIPLAKAYPFVAVNFILAAIAGMAFFGEKVSPLNGLGLLLIVAGITLATR